MNHHHPPAAPAAVRPGRVRPSLALLVAAVAACAGLVGCSEAPTAPQANPELRQQVSAARAEAFLSSHPGYFADRSEEAGMEALYIVNHDPLRPPPTLQHSAGYGRCGSAPQTRTRTLYCVSVMEGGRFYVAEFDPQDRSLVYEDGAWFLPTDRTTFLDEQLGLIGGAMSA